MENFENLKPENAIWEKYAGLFGDPDGERERFLEFERWRKVSSAWAARRSWPLICDDHLVDLKRIRNPLVIFASYGDNITHQALS